jgi:uncharacterized membrane protein (UPF0127 family)
MNKITGILAALLVLFTLPAHAEIAFSEGTLEIQTQKNESHFFVIEIAETQEQQSQGLMFRTKLDDDKGMIFFFRDQPYAAMWMKNTLIPLDMLFIDKTGKIIFIAENTTPESTNPISAYAPTAAVLELAGGISKKLGITAGDKVKHSYFEQ